MQTAANAPMVPRTLPLRTVLAAAIALLALQALVLHLMGQPWICACGRVDLWHGDPSGPETSQHLTDWYTLTHVVHGFAFYLLLWPLARHLALGPRFALALAIEAGWEILENTPVIIDRYREQALAQGYVGDSIVNSLGDSLAMAAGFLAAGLVPAWGSILAVLALELFTAVSIRDNLTLNILQLLHPMDSIARWQAGG